MPRSNDDSLRFTCPQCMARLKVSPALAGKRRRCPRCHLLLDVPQQSPTKPPSEEYPLSQEAEPLPAEVLPPADPATPAAARVVDEGYALWEEAPSTSGDRCAPQGPLIRITCPVCRTMMYATKEQVGQEIVCPDCRVPTTVPRPAEVPVKKPFRSAGEIGDYPLAEKTAVPPSPPPRRKADPTAEAGAAYRLAGWDETSLGKTGPQSRPPPPAADQPRAPGPTRQRAESFDERPTLPRWPFLSGTFSFPLARGARVYALVLAAWAMLPLGLVGASVQLAAVDLPSLQQAGYFVGSMMLAAVALVLAVIWLTLASACALGVVRDTANGCNEIQDWPDIAFLDWILDPLYIFDSVCVSLLPAVGVARWLTGSFQPDATLAAAALFVFFPIVLLSMLERNSPLGAISLPVYRTLWMAFRGWVTFYLATAVLLAAAGALVVAAFFTGALWAMIAVAAISAVVWLIYFRLLGRLAWYCAEHSAPAEPEAEPDAGPSRGTGNSTAKR